MKNLRYLVLLLAFGCGGQSIEPEVEDPGISVKPTPTSVDTDFDAFAEKLKKTDGLSANALLASQQEQYAQLDYRPTDAGNFELIQNSRLFLGDEEQTKLNENGFVITKNYQFPSFMYGYESIYSEDLPLFVSLDSVLEAVHRSYDDILELIERKKLSKELDALLKNIKASASDDASLASHTKADLLFYLNVAEGLLIGAETHEDPEVAKFLAAANEASGIQNRVIFGTNRKIDFSQFKPRGHYTNGEDMARYFRAMMWLGRIDFRLIEHPEENVTVLNRTQIEAAVALSRLMNDEAKTRWTKIDSVINAFVGEPDSMTINDSESMIAALGVDHESQIADIDDATLLKKILESTFGEQNIASHYAIGGKKASTPLNRSFLLFGQRYVFDSHVFSNVVFDRVLKENKPKRMMPSTLDVAYAALGSEQALPLLQEELEKYGYAEELESMRIIGDEHGEEFWKKNLYNLRLSAARAMEFDGSNESLPTSMRTEAWSKRILNTQLASWAELRHDTILYAKQSYSAGVACEFPDAYVDPYPAAWQAIVDFADLGIEVVDNIGLDDGPRNTPYNLTDVREYFVQLSAIAGDLKDMSERELRGEPFSEEQMTFINQAIEIQEGCGGPAGYTGWFPRLYFQKDASVGEFDPIIADVHTQPDDEAGASVGNILHVGTGLPRMMLVTANTCNGPRAYVGVVSAYHEVVKPNFERLTDEEWSDSFSEEGPKTDVPWLADVIAE